MSTTTPVGCGRCKARFYVMPQVLAPPSDTIPDHFRCPECGFRINKPTDEQWQADAEAMSWRERPE